MCKDVFHTVTPAGHGLRLDIFLARVAGYGVRAVKRLTKDGRVMVDGKPRAAHCKLAAGSVVAIREPSAPLPAAAIITAAATDEYLAFVKPPGLHTAAIAGRASPSLETALAGQWQAIRASLPETFSGSAHIPAFLAPFWGVTVPATSRASFPETPPVRPPELLTRLDAETSGLVLAAFSSRSAEKFRSLEAAGETYKDYLAVVHGAISEPFSVQNALDADNRKKPRVLPEGAADPTRRSAVVPIGNSREHVADAPEGTTLVTVRIKRGARHQIRAHLAHAGHPILGDALHGAGEKEAALHLHHAHLVFPGFEAFSLPPWLLMQ